MEAGGDPGGGVYGARGGLVGREACVAGRREQGAVMAGAALPT
jgi:hypothetical protein